MATIYKVDCSTRKPIFIGVQEENESNFIQFDITPWVEKHGAGVATANAKAPNSTEPYPVIVQRDGNIVTWKPKTADVAIEGVGAFQLIYTVGEVVARTQIWTTNIGPSLIGSGDPPDPIPDYIDEMREIAADALQSEQNSEAWAVGQRNGADVPSTDPTYENNAKYYAGQAAQEVLNAQDEVENAEAWAVGTKGGVDVPSTDPTYENNSKYWAEQSLANQYGAYIVKSASGEIASFSDGADDVPMKSLNVTITPKQSGSGDPSPSNVRPISGWTDADVTVVGKNLLSNDVYNLAPSGSTIASGASYRSAWCAVKGGETYTISRDAISGNRFRLYGAEEEPANGVVVTGLDANNDTALTMTVAIPDNIRYLFVYLANDGSTITSKLQLELGSTATAYEPYVNGHTTPVPLGQTVYGGSVDVATGVLTVDKMYYSFTGNESILLDQHYGVNRFDATVLPYNAVGASTDILCSHFLPSTTITSSNPRLDNAINAYNKRLLWRDDACATVADMKAYFTQQANNGTPVQAVVPMAPITVQLTPAQVATLLGTNNVWADCGSAEVEYRADPTLAYAELQALILENI